MKIKFLILIISTILIFGCNEKKTQNENSDTIEKRIAEKIAKHVIENDSLKMYKYSGEVLLHIISEKLNEENYKTYVSINGLKPKSTEFKGEKLNIEGFNTVIYYSKSKAEFNLPESFFVAHSKSWNFLSEFVGNDIILSQLKFVISNEENGIEELNEIDF